MSTTNITMAVDSAHLPRFQRSNLVISDMERAFTFYRDVLGFEVKHLSTHTKSSYAYELFQIDADAELREALLSTPSQTRVLGLTEVSKVELAQVPLPSRVVTVIEVKDLDQVIAASRELGLKIFEEDSLETVDGKMIREQGILDWDGNLVLVYMYMDAQ